jgi:hypothetical protein
LFFCTVREGLSLVPLVCRSLIILPVCSQIKAPQRLSTLFLVINSEVDKTDFLIRTPNESDDQLIFSWKWDNEERGEKKTISCWQPTDKAHTWNENEIKFIFINSSSSQKQTGREHMPRSWISQTIVLTYSCIVLNPSCPLTKNWRLTGTGYH